MAELKLFLLGNPRLELEGAPVRLQRRKALALLAYLAVTRKSCSRQELAALLWPEASTSKALMHLRNALYAITALPGPALITADLNTVALCNREIPWTDVTEFRRHRQVISEHHAGGAGLCAPCLDHLKQAAKLFTGDFMGGYEVPDSVEFELWINLQSSLLQDEFSHLIRTLIEYLIARKDWDEALQYGRQLLTVYPCEEDVHRTLMWIHSRKGAISDAVRQYEQCRQALKLHLNLPPDQQTVALLESIRAVQRRSLPVKHSRIPVAPSPFYGRLGDLDRLSALLDDPEKRLITITGMGGCGKTRLAMQAGSNVEPVFPDGAAWVPLAPIRLAEYILPALSEALEIKAPPERRGSACHMPDLKALLLQFLRNKQMLIILDNTEHLLSGLNFLPELITAAPGIKVLCTSRERLNIQAEWVFPLSGMAYPREAGSNSILQWDAAVLFTQSALRVNSQFAVTEDNRRDILDICRLVDGNPLALQLAAAWTGLLPCREIADEIQRNLDFLNSNLKDIHPRHQSIRAVFNHSWQLLAEPDRICLYRLSIFRGSFAPAAAREITGDSLSRLAAFLDKSLISRNRAGRFEIHELLRQFIEQQREAAGVDLAPVHSRHANYYLTLLFQLEPSLQGFNQKRAVQLISDDIGNIRAAWRWAAQNREAALLMSAAQSLFIYYDIKSLYREAAGEFAAAARLLTADPGHMDSEAAALFNGISGWFIRYFKPEIAREQVQNALNRLEAFPKTQAWALATNLYVFLGPASWTAETPGLLSACEAIFSQAGNGWGRAMTWEALGYCQMNHPRTAADAFGRSLALRRQNGDDWGVAMSLHVLAVLDEMTGDDERAAQRFQSSLTIRKRLDDDYGGMIHCLTGLGRVAARARNYREALGYYHDAKALADQIGNESQSYACAQIIDEIKDALTQRHPPGIFRDYSDQPNST